MTTAADDRDALAKVIDDEWTRPEHACGGEYAECQKHCPVPAYGRMGFDELRDAATDALLASDWLAQRDAARDRRVAAEAAVKALREARDAINDELIPDDDHPIDKGFNIAVRSISAALTDRIEAQG
jgi:hypothetical protein